jgi:ligand-binding sensor domain-containing protein
MRNLISRDSLQIILSLFLLLSSNLLLATEYDFKIYENKDGFNSPDNYFVFSDSRKLVWSCGSDGLTKYDGKTFSNYSKINGLNDSQVNCIVEDKKGRLVCGTRIGVSFFDGTRFQNVGLKISDNSDEKNQYVNCLYINSSNAIFAGTYNGLFKYNPKLKAFVRIDAFKKSVLSIDSDSKGRIFVSTKEGVFSFSNGKRTKIEPLFKGENFSISALKYIKNDLFWASTSNGFAKLLLIQNTFKIIDQKGGEIVNNILRIKENQFLFSGNTGKVHVAKNNELATYDLTNIFSHVQVKCAAQDYQGNIWLATTLGLIKMFESDVHHSNLVQDENSIVASVAKGKDKTIYFGTIDGLTVSKDGKCTNYKISDNPDDNFISAITYEHGELFVGTFSSKVFRFSNGKFEQLFDSKKTPSCIYRIISLDKNNKWIASYSDVIHIQNGKENVYNISNQYTQDILVDSKNRLWFANLSSIGYIDNGKIHSLNSTFKKYDNYVTLTEDPSGAIWIGTYGNGLLRYYKGEITQYSIIDGLTNNFVSSTYYDKKKNTLWVGTMYGVSKVCLNEHSNITSIENYLNGENIESYGCVQNAVCQLENGSMLFSVGDALFEIKSSSKNKNQSKIKLQIGGLHVNRKNISELRDMKASIQPWSHLPTSPLFNSTENNLDFNFSAIDFNSPYLIKYKWKLEGYDEKWTAYSERDFVNYTNLPNGEYTFKVQAINQNGEISNLCYYHFTINKPFYLEWWFLLLTSATAVSIFVGYFKFRIRKIKLVEKEKTQNYKRLAEAELKSLRAQMNPHFMFNTLNAIQEIVLSGDDEKTRIYFSDFAKMMRMILNNSAEKFISLERELEFLQLYLKFEQTRFQDKFQLKFHVDPKLETYAIKIPGMLIQPIIENAINHGLLHKKGERLLDIHFHEKIENKQHYLVCTIQDNGVGIRKDELENQEHKKTHRSMSSKISQERIAILNSLYGENMYKLTLHEVVQQNNEHGIKVELQIALN